MSKLIQTVKSGLGTFIERTGRLRLRRELLRYSDRALEDMGFSRELLETGLDAWPWRQGRETGVSVAEYRQAVKELNAYTDAELADLGLRRSDIKYAVLFGRPGIEFDRNAA